MSDISYYQHQASQWFQTLRNRLCATFEQLENDLAFIPADRPPGRFERKAWQRPEGGGGEMAVLKGRIFEKAGVNISTVHGEFSETMRKEMPNADQNPFFWASGISVVVHPCSPLVPAVHMNTRMLVLGSDPWPVADGQHDPASRVTNHTPLSTRHWFGGGADLTPMLPDVKDAEDFHAALQETCDRFSPDYYTRYKQWCDEYFYLKHRGEARGAGGIFYDYLHTDNTDHDFAFTRAIGETFHTIYPALVRRHMQQPWTAAQREQQLVKRGRYVEFNLLYDRGTRFGLLTGGNTEAILMSLPPEVKWL